MTAATDTSLLFVYGSLRPRSSHPVARLLADAADHVGPARVQGLLYRIDWYPGLVPSANPGDWVGGDLFRLHAPEKLLPLLDEFEECTSRFPQPHEYRRETTLVQQGEQRHAAWVYYYNRPVTGLNIIAE